MLISCILSGLDNLVGVVFNVMYQVGRMTMKDLRPYPLNDNYDYGYFRDEKNPFPSFSQFFFDQWPKEIAKTECARKPDESP